MSRLQNRSINVTAYAIALATAWTLLLVALAIWDVQHSLRHRKESILNEARANFFKDQAFRFWSAEHGGVYVPPSDHTPPNPYLGHVPNRDVVTTTGQRLTLVNPAYMVRQLMEDYEELYGIRGRITSKNPLRPENAPDPWEQAALDSFERGATEIAEYSDINGQPYLRLMRPMIAEKACLKCHAQQGYKEGDIRGGVGVSVPAAAYLAQANETASERRIVLGFIWLAGAFAIWWVGRDVRQRVRERELAENALRESERTKTTLISNLPGFAYRCANDPDWTMKYVSDGCKAVTGYDADDFLDNKTLAYNDIVHPDHQHTLWEEWQNIIERQGTFEAEYPIITASGETRWVWERGRGIYSDNGELQFLEGFITDITERRHAQESVRVMAEMLDTAPSSITVHDTEGRILYANQKTLDLHGYSRPELMALNLRDLDAPEGQALIPDRIRAIAREGEAAFEVIHIRKDGSVFPLEVIAKSVNWLGKQAIMGVCTDITERRRELEIASARSRILLTAFEYTTGDLLQYVLDEAEALTQSSIGFFHFLEADQVTLSPQAWSTRTVNEFCNAAGKGAHHPLGQAGVWADCIRTRRPVVYNDFGSLPHRKGLPSGHAAISRFVSIPVMRSDRIVAIIGVGNKTQDYTEADVETISRLADLCWDIIERKRVEEQLRQSQTQYQDLFNSVMEGICVVDENEFVKYCNPAFVDIFDAASLDDLVGRNLLDFIVADHHQRVINQTAERRKGLSSHYEIDIVSLGRRKKTLLVSVSPRFDAQKNYCGAFGAAVDITETKRLQELESRAQRLETAGQIAGQVAHDFNNMLAPMMAYPELIREQLPTDSSGIKYLDAIEDSAQRIADLNQQLLTLSRRGHYNQEILNLNNIVRHVVRDMGELPDLLVIETNLANDLMNIKGGVAQLHRVIMNLVVNARDAVRDVGKISIRTENYYVDDTTICYGRIPRGEFAKITISDTGCGIPDEVVQKIFDPFFTTKSTDKKRGSGLGLSVVDAVIKDHNGYIDLSTSIGAGTTFYLYFPITRAAITERETEEIPHGEETVLIVDDDEIQREVSARLLTTLGYRVTVCDSGRKAIELLQKKKFDILILDMIMPSDLDGTETFRQALQIRSDQKAIIVSGFSESDRVAEAQRLGAGAFVKKPLNRTVIALAVRRELDRIPAKSPRPASVG